MQIIGTQTFFISIQNKIMLNKTLKVLGITSSGQIKHTLRKENDGTWQSFFGDLEQSVAKKELTHFKEIASFSTRENVTIPNYVGLGVGDLQNTELTTIMALDDKGKIHTFSNYKKSTLYDRWSFGDIGIGANKKYKKVSVFNGKETMKGDPNPILFLLSETPTLNGNLEIYVCDNFYANLFTTKSFQPEGTIILPEFVDIDSAIFETSIHLVAANIHGEINIVKIIKPQVVLDSLVLKLPNNEKVIKVACCNVKGKLHITAVSANKNIFHIIFKEQNVWGNIENPVGESGNVVDISCACVDSVLHVVAISDNGKMLHTLRKSNGTWQK